MSEFDSYSPPVQEQIEILYQDEYLLAVNKPPGLLSVPGRGEHKQDCLTLRIKKQFPQVKVIHRLDMPTSGLMLLALTQEAQIAMSRLFEQRQVIKKYIAIVEGIVEQQKGIVDEPMICDWPNRPKQKIDYAHGKQAITAYKVISKSRENDSTRVELLPKTGRSHQLRVHMASLHHPILGDNLYANEKASKKQDRLLLHATEISFMHPISNKSIKISCDCPF